ncbi:MAG: GAF domain-containing protein [Xanthomonadales bacterium]|nr:GAF domain-containing protein [Xanthomonadales bacterium]
MKLPRATLQNKVLGGLALFFLVFVVILFYTSWAFERNAKNSSITQRVSQLELTLGSVSDSSERYLEAAPRDYESYNRDVTIFFKDVMSDITRIGEGIQVLSDDYQQFTEAGFFAGMLGLGGRDGQLENSINNLQEHWRRYESGLDQQLGGNKAEPRLEWGAQFIARERAGLQDSLNAVGANFERVLLADLKRTQLLTNLAIVFAILFAAAGVAWFYFGVTRRIQRTVCGCRRVAQGDFGFQLTHNSTDELGQLIDAFNSLSARARLVLSVLDRLREGQTPAEASEILWEETRAALSAEWFALVSAEGEQIELVHAFPEDAMSKVRNLADVGEKEQAFTDAIKSGRPQYFPDLLRHSVANANARFIRDLHKSGFRSALFVPLIGESHVRCVMVLAAKTAGAFTSEQVILLHRIGPMIAHQLENNVVPQQNAMPNAAAANAA